MTADFRDNEESYRGYYDEIEVIFARHCKTVFHQRSQGRCVFHNEIRTALDVNTINLCDIVRI